MNGQGAGVKAEQVKLEAMENGKAANKAPKAGADGKTVDPSGYDEKTKQKAERIVEKEKYKDVNFWQEHKKENDQRERSAAQSSVSFSLEKETEEPLTSSFPYL